MKEKKSIPGRPNIRTVLWWDWDYEKMDFRKAHRSIIALIIERGTADEYAEMVRFYGIEQVISDLKQEIWFLTDHAIERASNYFSLKKEEMKCYTHKQSHKTYWF